MSYPTTPNRSRMTAASTQSPANALTHTATGYSGLRTPGATESFAITIPDDGASLPSRDMPPKKRKREVIAISDDSDDGCAAAPANATPRGSNPTAKSSKPRAKKVNKGWEPPVEKRVREFRAYPPQGYQDRLERALSQLMFLLDRERKMSEDGTHEKELFDMAGTTGNVYQITIGKLPQCTCPDAIRRGNQCKHIIYVMANVLKAPEHLQYQLALLSTELAEIFANAPVTPQSSAGSSEDTSDAGKRKPVEGDCPVCVMEFEAGEDIIWCKAACGNNIHKACFERWAKSKPGEVKCVYCRTPWKDEEGAAKKVSTQGEKNEEGYVNVGSELGLSGTRDYSSYHQPWARSRGYGGYGYHDLFDGYWQP